MSEREIIERLVAVERDQAALDRLLAALHRERENAANLASRALEHRLESLNAARKELDDQAARFFTRAEYEDKHQLLLDRLEEHDARDTIRFEQHERAINMARGAILIIPLLMTAVGFLVGHFIG